MADEPSIDEILASLDQLLREGEGSNDEPAESAQQTPAKESAKEPTKEPAKAPAKEPDLRFLMALDRAQSDTSGKAGKAARDAAAKDTDAGKKPEQDAGSKGKDEKAGQPGAKRIILTDTMMVDDVQQSLPLAPGDTVLNASAASAPAAPKPRPDTSSQAGASRWDERDIQALVDQVTDDVCSAMAEQLPEMIRRALAQRLAAFIKDRMRNQNSESEE